MRLVAPLKYTLYGLVLALITAGGGVLWLLGTETGRLWLVDRGLALAENAGLRIVLEDLASPTLSHWQAGHLRVSTDAGPLVEVRDLRLQWRPRALLAKHLAIDSLTAGQVTYFHPQTENTDETPEDDSDPFRFPLRLTLDQLAVDRLALHQLPGLSDKVLPEYHLAGGFDVFGPDHPLRLQLELQSLETEETWVRVDTQLVTSGEVQIQGSVAEAPGGLLGGLARWPAADPLAADFRLRLIQKGRNLHLALEEIATQIVGHSVQVSGSLDYDLDKQSLQVPALTLLLDGRPQTLKGGYSPTDLWLQANLDTLPLDLVTPWYADIAGGTASGQLELSWAHKEPGRWPEASAQLQGDLIYAQHRLMVALTGGIKDRQLTLQPSQVRYGTAELAAQGVLDFEGAASDLRGTLRQFHTDLLAPWGIELPEGLTASADQARFHLRGAIRQPHLTLATQAKGVYQQHPFDLTVEGEADRQRATFQRLHLVSGDATLQAKGKLDWSGGHNDLQLTLHNLRETLLQLAPPQFAEQFPEGLTLTANGEAMLKGPLRQPLVESRSTLTGTYVLRGETLPYRLELQGSLTSGSMDQLQLQADQVALFLADQPVLSLQGRYQAQALDLHLHLDQLPTQALAALGWRRIDGEATADLRLQGTAEQPILDGYLEYRDHLPGRARARVPLKLRADVTTVDNRLTLATRFQRNGESLGQLEISLPASLYLQHHDGPLPLDLHAKGEWELHSLRVFTDLGVHRLDGRTQMDMTFSGHLQQPIVQGQLELRNGSYHNQMTGTQLEDITLLLVGNGEQLSIREARARSGDDGELQLAGSVFWQPERRQLPDAIDLSLTLRRAMLLQQRDLSGEVNGKVQVAGSFAELWVKGDMKISPLNASVESAIKTQIPQIQVTEIKKSIDEAAEDTLRLPEVHLDIQLRADQQAFLRGRGLDAELGGKIAITGTLEAPQYNGIFTTRRGRLELFGKRFVLEQGEVRFNNDGAILRIPAVHKTQDIEIRAELHGTDKEPKLSLSSVPALPNDEILSRLIFGKSAQDISAFEAIRLAGAVRSLTSGGGFDPVDSARDLLGVDSLTIDTESSADGSSSYTTVGVGKYLNERVYVELGRSTNPVQPWVGSMEIELSPSVTLESRTNQTGGAGAVLMWKRDY
jgi:translocation and assembly module TamB